MFNNYKKGLVLLATGIVTTMAGCQKEEEPLDLEVPAVTLEISGNPAKLYNETTLSATATDNDTISRVVFYVNSDSIGQATEKPYELKWNTKNVEDGSYTLKVAAYDASGNKNDAVLEVTINNTLFVMYVEDGYFQAREGLTQDQWIFLSDKNGKVIGEAKQALNGAKLQWERPVDYNTDTFYFNRLYYNSRKYEWTEKTYTGISVYTYTDFMLEEAYLKAYNSPDSIGKVDITIENDFDGVDYYSYETRVPYHRGSSWTTSNVTTYAVSMEENSQKGFSTYEKTDRVDQNLREKYYRFDDLKAGNSYNSHTNDYAAMDDHTISFPFEIGYAYVNTTGYLDIELQKSYPLDYASLWDNQSQELKVFSANAFPHIRTYISAETGNKYFYKSTMKQGSEVVSIPQFSATVQTKDMKNIEVTTNGIFDVGNSFWEHMEDTDTRYLSARRGLYFSSASGSSYVLPEIPASLLELYPSLNNQMELSSNWAGDNKALDSYEDNLKYWFSATDNYDGLEATEYSGLYIYPENSGARKMPAQRTNVTEDMMKKEEYLQARGIPRR
jgi:hypothetical protein